MARTKASPRNCVSCGCLFTPLKYHHSRKKYSSYNHGKTCSRKCQLDVYRYSEERKAKISAAFTGDKHPNWQGGKARLNNISNRGTGWQEARRAALKRDGYKCQECGISNDGSLGKYGRGLDVDHVIPFHNFTSAKRANRLSNLICRCASCHRKDEAKRSNIQMALPFGDSLSRVHKGYVRGKAVNTAKLTEGLVYEARKRKLAGESTCALARVFGVNKTTMSSIIRGKSWKHVPHPKASQGL